MPMNVATVRRRQYRSARKPKQRVAPLISVIIPAHNEETYLRQTLQAVQRQHYQTYEVIVVANGCSDGTPRIAQNRCDKLLVLKEKGLSHARNLGAKAARGDILLFLDADTLLEVDAL